MQGTRTRPVKTRVPVLVELFRTADRNGLSYRQLADKSGVDRSAVGRWRSGKTMPKLAELTYVAAALGYEVTLVKKPAPASSDSSDDNTGRPDV